MPQCTTLQKWLFSRRLTKLTCVISGYFSDRIYIYLTSPLMDNRTNRISDPLPGGKRIGTFRFVGGMRRFDVPVLSLIEYKVIHVGQKGKMDA